MISFEKLEQQRKVWKPYPMKKEVIRFPGENLDEAINKSIALGLVLELPVAEWVSEARKKMTEMEVPKIGITSLMKNIKDEGVHYQGFLYAAEAYPESKKYMSEATSIYRAWDGLNIHPLWIAAMAETGIFLASLAVLRLCGGNGLSDLVGDISKDEYRHVACNRAVLKILGHDLHSPPAALNAVREQTIDWLFQGFSVPALDIDKQFMIDQSTELVYTGRAPELSELTAHSEYTPPFERSNSRMY
jgi:hypothetical protein